jgi:hypothetical protein
MPSIYWAILFAIGASALTAMIMKRSYDSKIDKIESVTEVQIMKLGMKLGFSRDVLTDQDAFVEHLEKHGFHSPIVYDSTPHFKVADEGLDLLMNLGGDMLIGRANMDTAIWFMQALDQVLDRLRPHEAPFHDGLSTIIKPPASNVS